MKGYQTMAKQLSGTEVVGKLRQADVLLAQGKTVPEVCREIGVSQQTYYPRPTLTAATPFHEVLQEALTITAYYYLIIAFT